MSDYAISVLSRIGMESFVALSAYLLLLMGRVSFGQQAFFAIGAYAAGLATAVFGAPLWLGLLDGAALAAAAAALLGLLLARASTLGFAVGSLAFAELVRLGLLGFAFRREVAGEPVGPLGAEGFRGVRLAYVNGLGPAGLLLTTLALLALTLAALVRLERSRAGAVVRMIGEDPIAAATVGVRVRGAACAGVAASGALAGLGGALFVHWATYVEPGHAEVMLGVHSLAYGLIGGLGTPLGPVIGAAVDIGFLESFRAIQAYRMILFGGLVALFLIVRPRGLLDERLVHAMTSRLSGLRGSSSTRRAIPDGPVIASRPPREHASTRQPLLRIAGAAARFDRIEALAGVDLTIAEGEIVGLIGPNGSGKTTLLDAVSGLARISAGVIALGGTPVTGRTPDAIARAGVGRCFQTPRVFERMTVLANARAGQLALPRAERDPGEPRALLDRCGLGHLADRLAGNLNPAERRRLELARALAGRPRLLLLDEPCAGLAAPDAEAAVGTLGWAARGRAVVLVEHRMPIVSRLCPRVVVLDRGRVIADGTPDSVRADHAVIDAFRGRPR